MSRHGSRPADAAVVGRREVAGDVVVHSVTGARALREFLHLPWRIHAGDPNWVPPLLRDQKLLLDRTRHPFHAHAEVMYFLARRGEQPVGRIAAVVNRRHNEIHDERTGFFGFFDCDDDEAVCAALFQAAEAWLAARGMDRVRGPASFSTNEECGLLVDGFDRPPVVMMPYNPPRYASQLEAAGYRRAKDLLAFLLDDTRTPERLIRGVERLRRQRRVEVRPLRMRRFEDELRTVQRIYNGAWQRNWGFVPMTDAEVSFMARQLKPVIDPRLCLFAEVEGQPIAFGLALPDLNQVLRRLNGRLLPFGVLKALWYRRRIDGIRVLALGVLEGYRKLGVDAMLYLRLWLDGLDAGYRWAECSWILEDNWDMRRGLERLGGRVYKTYRMYEKPL